METSTYHPEPYWSQVAREIVSRETGNVVAGDDEPYYRYKREKFLGLLLELPFRGKSVLEVGPGPGGNLLALERKGGQARLAGCDISDVMLKIARERVSPATELFKTDGTRLPFADGEFDVVFSATVLQHNSDEAMFRGLLAEMARVATNEVVLFEQVDRRVSGDALRVARPVAVYAERMEDLGFRLLDRQMIQIVASYYVSGAIRKVCNPRSRREGEPPTALANALQRMTLPITSVVDRYIGRELDLARMHFVRKGPQDHGGGD